MQSSKSKQRGGNCGAGMCSLQMGGKRTVRKTKQRGRGCGCQGANSVKGLQMGGKRSKRSRSQKRKRGGALASGSEVSLRKK